MNRNGRVETSSFTISLAEGDGSGLDWDWDGRGLDSLCLHPKAEDPSPFKTSCIACGLGVAAKLNRKAAVKDCSNPGIC